MNPELDQDLVDAFVEFENELGVARRRFLKWWGAFYVRHGTPRSLWEDLA